MKIQRIGMFAAPILLLLALGMLTTTDAKTCWSQGQWGYQGWQWNGYGCSYSYVWNSGYRVGYSDADKNASIIMASAVAVILTTSVLAFALPNQAIAQPVMLGSGPFVVGVYGNTASVKAPGLAISAASGAAPSLKVNTPGLGLSASGGTVGLALPGGFGCWPCPECCPCPSLVGGGSGPTR